MLRDLHNNADVELGVKPVAIGTTGTGQVGKVIDRRGYGGVEFVIGYGEITATNAAYTVTVKEGDVTGTMTSVADGDLLGTEAAATPGTGARASGTTKNVFKRIGYKGVKRYVQCGVKSTVTAGTLVTVAAVLHRADRGPVAT